MRRVMQRLFKMLCAALQRTIGSLRMRGRDLKIARCSGCNAPLDATNDSEAHIIPKALGGRLAPKGLICRVCNSKLDRLADNALIVAFGAWPTLLDIPRQGGGNPPKQIETREGHKLKLEASGALTRVDVIYETQPLTEGQRVQIGAGDKKIIRQLLNLAAKQFPTLDVAAAEAHAKTVGLDPETEIKMSVDFSPKAVFGGVITALWLFLLKETGRTFVDWNRLCTCIVKMQAHGGTFRYFIKGLPGLNGPQIDVGHKIVVRSVPNTGELIGYVEILGILRIGGVIARNPNVPSGLIEHVYAYDVMNKVDRSSEYSIHPAEFETQDWTSVGLGVADSGEYQHHLQEVLESVFVAHYRNRSPQP